VSPIVWEFSKRRTARPPMGTRPILNGVYPCADGYVEFTGAGTRWDRFQVDARRPGVGRGPEVARPRRDDEPGPEG
jgi:hypothetical protein